MQDTYVVDGITWECTWSDDEVHNYDIVAVDESVPYDEEAAELLFANVMASEGAPFKFEVGLAGRMGDAEFEGFSETFEEAARMAYEVLYREGMNTGGRLFGIDAIR